jgi:hypothetical protein
LTSDGDWLPSASNISTYPFIPTLLGVFYFNFLNWHTLIV